MRDVVIVAGCRTPIGTIGGQFKTLAPVELTIPVMQNLIKRAGIDPVIIDDVIWGCNYQRTYKENNLARVAAVKAGLPVTVPGITIHRNCTSSMSAIQMGFYQIRAGEAECIMAGGSDSMSTAPHMVFNARYGQKYGHMEMRDSMWDSLTNLGVGPAMGITAENVAEQWGLTREQLDEFAATSQQKCEAAQKAGKFKDEIVPVEVKKKKETVIVDTDEGPRPGTTKESISKLRPAFKPDGIVTAANASGINDGAAAVVVMSEKAAKELGVKPMATFVAGALGGVDPSIMGVGPVASTKKVFAKTGLTIDDMDLVEANEAFAAQSLAVAHDLNFDMSKVNVNGGAIALGHPVGASGCRILVTLLHEMQRRDAKKGLATLCIGGGMGCSTIVERD